MKVGPSVKIHDLVQQLLALVNPAQARYQATLMKRGLSFTWGDVGEREPCSPGMFPLLAFWSTRLFDGEERMKKKRERDAPPIGTIYVGLLSGTLVYVRTLMWFVIFKQNFIYIYWGYIQHRKLREQTVNKGGKVETQPEWKIQEDQFLINPHPLHTHMHTSTFFCFCFMKLHISWCITPLWIFSFLTVFHEASENQRKVRQRGLFFISFHDMIPYQ